MVVDDERDISLIFKSGLERKGYAVDVFSDPYDALSHYKPAFYDLLLLDVRMPGMSGLELFSKILQIDSAAKACFISAFEIHKTEVEKYIPNLDEACIVRKPISLEALVTRVNNEISGKL